MKEAAGEANMTVITIVLIAIVLTVGGIIVNNVLNNTGKSSACQMAGAVWKNGNCCTDDACGTKLTCSKASKDNTTTGVKKGDWTCKQ